MKAVANGRIVDNTQGAKQEDGDGHQYKGAVNTCLTDDGIGLPILGGLIVCYVPVITHHALSKCKYHMPTTRIQATSLGPDNGKEVGA